MVALGDTLTFLDSHVEVNEKWIEPLMTKIKQNPKIIVAPIIGMKCHYTQHVFFAHFFVKKYVKKRIGCIFYIVTYYIATNFRCDKQGQF